MDKKIAGLIGAVAGLAAISSAQAAISPAPNPVEPLQASSYADLLAPIANAVALLRADDAARAAEVQVAQYYNPAYPYQYHHHHHHHRAYRRVYHRRSHHHHHHNRAFIGIPGVAGVVVGRH